VELRVIRATEADVARFMRHVDKLPSGCWFWTGARSRGKGNKKWYGTFTLVVNGKRTRVRAHRFSCEAIKGAPCPPGHDRDHTCRFSMCVCPDHIEVVTKRVNHERKLERRRVA
jgi:hypothetical protein